jgi:acyl-CoA thioesterase-1
MKKFILAIAIFLFGCLEPKTELPKILIIGDSISGGYFPIVKKSLMGKAKVFQATYIDKNGKKKGCCGGTSQGVKEIDIFLSAKKWDIIHFNFGLHDIKHVDPVSGKNSKNLSHPHQASPKEYERNLVEIIKKLKRTGAKLIFATTTPYPDKLKRQMRSPGMPKIYNQVALKIMNKNQIKINDIYSLVLPKLNELQIPNNVHFNEKGSKFLAGLVIKSIMEFI